ncbi:DEAD/DEAH box helicase family protein [bacterium]|nr:DEAD/DEAH box helicase family protein [bacterium]
MKGYIVKDPRFGIGRVLESDGRSVTVQFYFPPQSLKMTHKSLVRTIIPLGYLCTTDIGICTVCGLKLSKDLAPHIYIVEFEDGVKKELPETSIISIEVKKIRDPVEMLASYQHEGLPIFKEREQLLLELISLAKQCAGVKSLLSSRIDLHPHQAYVAGIVLLDSNQRYILADEVGLGKTIEAGIVIHDILAHNPNANILIICPSTLVQQWFAELYSKFSGVIFHLPELSGFESLETTNSHRIILSYHSILQISEKIFSREWDLVVVDEVHHLLYEKPLYKIVRQLSLKDSGLLLLSALPAQHREEEYYNLLALLEPMRYDPDCDTGRKQFGLLFDRQKEIGGRLGVLKRRLTEFQNGEHEQIDRIIAQVNSLVDIPVLNQDNTLKSLIDRLDAQHNSFLSIVQEIIYHISDYYRINRRILRNRRELLIEKNRLDRISRDYRVFYYRPNQYELEAYNSLDDLLTSIHLAGLREDILFPLAKYLYQAICEPNILYNCLIMGTEKQEYLENDDHLEVLFDLISYSEWYDQMEYFWNVASEYIDETKINNAVEAVHSWMKHANDNSTRYKKFVKILENKHSENPGDKFIIFAGFPELANLLYVRLSNHFNPTSIARFYFGIQDDSFEEQSQKEKEIRRFKNDKNAWLLVSDETGGEGRNFQFVSELFHYDLPIQVSKIEQRIGRLDRLGREKSAVISNLIVGRGTQEEAWFICLTDGLGIFNQSISGLEFFLKDIELNVARNLLSSDDHALWEMPSYIKGRVNEERGKDESQNQLDEASFERMRAEKFHSIQSNNKHENKLKGSFIQYFKHISQMDSFEVNRQLEQVTFHPNMVSGVNLNLSEKERSRKGTFYRRTAQNHPEIEFFSVGNEFFDSVCRSLFDDPKGRTYAVECNINKDFSWRGFEYSYKLISSNTLQGKSSSHSNIIDSIFTENVEYCFINEDCEVANQYNNLLRFRKSLCKGNKNRIWKNLTKNKLSYLLEYYDNWSELVHNSERVAYKEIKKRFEIILSEKLKLEFNNIDDEIIKLKSIRPENWEEEVTSYKQLKKVISEWDLQLNSLGFLSINGGILDY